MCGSFLDHRHLRASTTGVRRLEDLTLELSHDFLAGLSDRPPARCCYAAGDDDTRDLWWKYLFRTQRRLARIVPCDYDGPYGFTKVIAIDMLFVDSG